MGTSRFVSIGKITGTHGVRGAVKLLSYSDSANLLGPDARISVRYIDGRFSELTVGWIKPHKKGFLLFFKESATFEQASALAGAELLMERGLLPETEEDEYYWVDLIGLSVFSDEGAYLGRLESIFPTGSNDVYVVKSETKEILVPALESVVLKVDLSEGTMLVRLPEGL